MEISGSDFSALTGALTGRLGPYRYPGSAPGSGASLMLSVVTSRWWVAAALLVSLILLLSARRLMRSAWATPRAPVAPPDTALEVPPRPRACQTELAVLALGMIRREVAAPLSRLLNLSPLLTAPDLSAAQRDALYGLQQSGQRVLLRLHNLLDLCQAEGDSAGELQRVPYSARDLVRGVAAVVADEARRKGVELCVDVRDSVPALLLGDPGRLRQVLLSLLSSAIHATARGWIELRARVEEPRSAVVLGGEPGGTCRRLCLEVEDTGGGLLEEVRGRVQMCQRLIELMGGEIIVDTHPDQGSRCTVCMPLEEP